MPILLMAVLALAIFGVMGLMLALAEFSEHHPKLPENTRSPQKQ